jgi:Mn-containing catalase
VYERLINFTDDSGTKEAPQFLMTREISHMRAFTAALDTMGKPQFSIGLIAPAPGLVDQFFRDSTGEGGEGETDSAGPILKAAKLEEVESTLADGEGLDNAPADPVPHSEQTSKFDSTPVGPSHRDRGSKKTKKKSAA